MKNFGLYIHIPFCESKCYYCDFNSYARKNSMVETYINYLKQEIMLYKEKVKDYTLKTIFIGGGTPSHIDGHYIKDVLDVVYATYNIDSLEEVTIEANPKTLDKEKLMLYQTAGINRISLGVQTLNNALLKDIGRIHTAEDFVETYELVRGLGFDNINADVMFNLPNQTLEDVMVTLKQMIDLKVDHISFYSLKLEAGTPFYKKYHDNPEALPDEDVERSMYDLGIKLLEEHGYCQYEISNFAQPNKVCKHNEIYWKVEPYLGVGLGAHSNMFHQRWGNLEEFDAYFAALDETEVPTKEIEIIDPRMEMAEFVILGLRMNQGIGIKDFYERFGVALDAVYGDLLKGFEEEKMLDCQDQRVRLTKKGMDFSNRIFAEILPD